MLKATTKVFFFFASKFSIRFNLEMWEQCVHWSIIAIAAHALAHASFILQKTLKRIWYSNQSFKIWRKMSCFNFKMFLNE